MTDRPTLLCLHGLGSSGRAWRELAAHYDGPCDTPDLPGFGAARPLAGPSTPAYADWVTDRLEGIEGPAVLVGWSMGGKFALAAAARRPERLAGVVLLAPSPPGGEPMAEDERRAFVADGPTAANAAANADQSPGAPLRPHVRAEVVEDWRRSDPETFRWWFRTGSLQVVDVSGVEAPVLILGGARDAQLGAAAQAGLTAAKLERVQVESLPAIGHLVPREAPALVAEHIAGWLDGL